MNVQKALVLSKQPSTPPGWVRAFPSAEIARGPVDVPVSDLPAGDRERLSSEKELQDTRELRLAA